MPTLRTASLAEYRTLVCGLERPSAEQIDSFVEFVGSAHSWYKHLPLFPPGVPFHFFLDPYSGFDHILAPDGTWRPEERAATSQRFHYTWMMTEEYRRRFGYLQYSAEAGSAFLVHTRGNVLQYEDLPVLYTADDAFHLPPEVVEAGMVELTAVIHPRARHSVDTWNMMLGIHDSAYAESRSETWPAESGGKVTLRQITGLIDRLALAWEVHRTSESEFDALWTEVKRLDAELEALVLPEVRRLQAKQTEAINRMLDLVLGQECE